MQAWHAIIPRVAQLLTLRESKIYIDNQEGSIAVNSSQCHINPFGFRVSFARNAMSLADHDLHFHGQNR